MTDAAGLPDPPTRDQVDAVMRTARVLVGVTARSFAAIEDRVTLPQLRIMVMIASRGPLNLGSIAASLDVHPSNASRACDRLVAAGLLDRRDDPADRRNLLLQLTDAGARLVDEVTTQRRQAIHDTLEKMPVGRRRSLVAALSAFADAAGEPAEAAWSLGWTTENPVRSLPLRGPDRNGAERDGT
ncbi:MarR family transcriptional regulator [Pseudonocardia sp. RS11V-5]|uniref:MarR family winged helix-turn-helix transcriptional regulator n=1 Tax=Pseudonocardia terrae TaxID=2905831 RepID=UPI001E4CD1FC|nr:MarR family transcriptional regulator [Pseudonocardia terrae]MCE3551494.1 MarR family transcriptional regulator [Pseudonocardia terrae]